MDHTRSMTRLVTGMAAAIALSLFATTAEAREATYDPPKLRGFALDLCLKPGQKCGRPAADAFCRSKGHVKALGWSVQKNSPPTRIIGTGDVCRAPGCDRISRVRCLVAEPKTRTFVRPKVGGKALDLCREWGRNCGRPAATAYCRSKGYRKAIDFQLAKNRPPTRIISSGRVCNAPECDRISRVTCTKTEPQTRPRPATRTFRGPMIRGKALDLCREWGRSCGRPAADAYCRSKGYRRASELRVGHNRPPTRIISSGRVCNAPECDRITQVTCTERAPRAHGPAPERAGRPAESKQTTPSDGRKGGGKTDDFGDVGDYEEE